MESFNLLDVLMKKKNQNTNLLSKINTLLSSFSYNDGKETELKYTYTKKCNNYDVCVMSGVGFKGIVFVGILHELNNYLENIKIFIGTSIGAVISLLLIVGYRPIEIFSHFCTFFANSSFDINIAQLINKYGFGVLDGGFNKIKDMIISKVGFIPTFKQLQDKFGKRLICASYNLTKHELEYLGDETTPDLDCLMGIKMSSNIPLMNEKVVYKDCYYLDGVLGDKFPIQYAQKTFPTLNILGMDVPPEENTNSNLFNYIMNIAFIPVYSVKNNINMSSKTDIISLIQIPNFDAIQHKYEIFEIGNKIGFEFATREKKVKTD